MVLDVSQSLDDIRTQIRQLDKTQLNPQQQLFANHIENATNSLIKQVKDLPSTSSAHLQVFPVLGDQFLQPLVAIYGYAKLLLDSPASFDGATISADKQPHLELIFQLGRKIESYIESLKTQVFDYRLAARNQPMQTVDLCQLVSNHIGIYRYWIKDRAIQLVTAFSQERLLVFAKPYHLNALIQHIVTVIATELLEYGIIQLSAQSLHSTTDLHIFCTGLQFNDTHRHTLFSKDGRNTYLKHLNQMNGEIVTQIHTGKGSTIIIRLRG